MLIGYSVRFNLLTVAPSAAAAAWRTNAPPISRPENHVEAHCLLALKNLALGCLVHFVLGCTTLSYAL